MSNSAQVDTQRNSAPPANPEATNARMLIADDSYMFRERLAVAFRDRGFRVTTAEDFESALTLIPSEVSDLAVIDPRMPGGPGLDLVKELTQVSPDTAIVVLTGYGSIATAIDAIRLGATYYLPKPADADDILAAFKRDGEDVADDEHIEEERQVPSLAQAEWEHIHRVLADCDGNISEAARRLGIHRRSLQRKLRKRAPD